MAVAVDRALEELLEHLRSRFYGKYHGVVTDVDPATCRIKAQRPRRARRSQERLVPAVRALCRTTGRHRLSPGGRERGVDRIRGG